MHDEIADFLRYWVGLRGTDELPSRDSVDPLSIPRHLLSKVHLMTYDEAHGDIRFTIAGPLDDLVQGDELSGSLVSDLPNRIGGSRAAYAQHIHELYRLARRSGKPVHSRGTYRWADGQPEVITERITCPILARDGWNVEFTGLPIYERATAPGVGKVYTADDYIPAFVRVIDDPDSLVAGR